MRSHLTRRHDAAVAAVPGGALYGETGFPAARGRLQWPVRLGELIRVTASGIAPASTILVRAIVGAVFLLEGALKFVDPAGFGVGRFVKIGIPFPAFSAPFDGVFEIVCGLGLMLGLLTRLAAVPMIINMLVAITSTKIPILLHEGFLKAAHEARLDVAMLLSCVFLLIVGSGSLSLDALLLAPARRGHGEAGGYEWDL
ncbi:MAG TPA: DoxX family protein [Candidatus Polarisedimenticolia bacterium]|nr:DoxX family protein [Candidatus Polarisedimenticolia bacterium]